MIARRPLLRIAAPLIALGMLAAACSDDPDEESVEGPTTSADESAGEPVEPVDFSGRGPYAVGTVDLQVGSEHTIAVFYPVRSEEHTSELQSLMRISYAVFCLQKKQKPRTTIHT